MFYIFGDDTKLYETKTYFSNKRTFRIFVGQRMKNLHAVKIAENQTNLLIFFKLLSVFLKNFITIFQKDDYLHY